MLSATASMSPFNVSEWLVCLVCCSSILPMCRNIIVIVVVVDCICLKPLSTPIKKTEGAVILHFS